MPKLLLADIPDAMEQAAIKVKEGIKRMRTHLTCDFPQAINFGAEIIVGKDQLARISSNAKPEQTTVSQDGGDVSVSEQSGGSNSSETTNASVSADSASSQDTSEESGTSTSTGNQTDTSVQVDGSTTTDTGTQTETGNDSGTTTSQEHGNNFEMGHEHSSTHGNETSREETQSLDDRIYIEIPA